MNSRLIILLGATNSGKTATFQLLRDLLLSMAQESNHSQQGADIRDFEAVYTTKNRRIYVCSMGDYIDRIQIGLDRARLFECDTAIIAFNTTFSRTYMNDNLVPGGSVTLRKRISQDVTNEELNQAENLMDVNDLLFLSRLR